MLDCKIINMTLNGVSASENTTVEIRGSCISGSGMAGLYLEGSCNVTLRNSHLYDNYCCLSVWGGWGEERHVKCIGTDPREEEDVMVTPTSTLAAFNNKLVGIIWAGMTRPMNFEEQDNEIQEDAELSEDDEELVPFHLEEGEGEDKAKTLQGQNMWDIYEPISTPKWAPKGKLGGDGVVQWGPSEGIVDRDPFVLLDVDFSENVLKRSPDDPDTPEDKIKDGEGGGSLKKS